MEIKRVTQTTELFQITLTAHEANALRWLVGWNRSIPNLPELRHVADKIKRVMETLHDGLVRAGADSWAEP